MRSSGSRVDIAQNQTRVARFSTLEIFFVIFTKLIPRRIFFCIANILGVDGNNNNKRKKKITKQNVKKTTKNENNNKKKKEIKTN